MSVLRLFLEAPTHKRNNYVYNVRGESGRGWGCVITNGMQPWYIQFLTHLLVLITRKSSKASTVCLLMLFLLPTNEVESIGTQISPII